MMIAIQFHEQDAPKGQAEARRFASPVREEWQPDGTWTGLFDISEDERAAFRELVQEVSQQDVKIKELESEDDIGGHRMALYVFGAVPDS